MAAMEFKSSSIEKERLSLEQAVERFRSRAVAEFWRLEDRLPRSDTPEFNGANPGPTTSTAAWEQARRRHHLARQGLIPWQADLIPQASPVTALRNERRVPRPSNWSVKPRAA
jgi:hypothetical protein